MVNCGVRKLVELNPEYAVQVNDDADVEVRLHYCRYFQYCQQALPALPVLPVLRVLLSTPSTLGSHRVIIRSATRCNRHASNVTVAVKMLRVAIGTQAM